MSKANLISIVHDLVGDEEGFQGHYPTAVVASVQDQLGHLCHRNVLVFGAHHEVWSKKLEMLVRRENGINESRLLLWCLEEDGKYEINGRNIK